MGQVRIIGGMYRSRILKFADNITDLRPSPDRVREVLFNWLGQDLTNKVCLDLFSGSGAVGFEAASRNAKEVTLVEVNPTVVLALNKNKELLSATNVKVIHSDAQTYLKELVKKNLRFDLIFLDPPYASDLLGKVLEQLLHLPILNEKAKIYIEYQVLPHLSGYEVIKHKKAGKVHFALLEKIT